jgi:hypothetical protein
MSAGEFMWFGIGILTGVVAMILGLSRALRR